MAAVVVAFAPFGVLAPFPIVLANPWVIITPNGFNAAVNEITTLATAIVV